MTLSAGGASAAAATTAETASQHNSIKQLLIAMGGTTKAKAITTAESLEFVFYLQELAGSDGEGSVSSNGLGACDSITCPILLRLLDFYFAAPR